MTRRRCAPTAAASFVAVVAVLLLMGCSSSSSSAGDPNPAFDAKPIATYAYPIQMFPNEVPGGVGRHFAQGEFKGYGTVHYNTDPPTSGQHVGEFAQPGIHDMAVPSEILVHMMEHGYVIIWYNCAAAPVLTQDACATLQNSLAQMVSEEFSAAKHVVMVPEGTMPHHIALTAWQFMDAFDEFDATRVRTFIDTFNCRFDPEGGCQ